MPGRPLYRLALRPPLVFSILFVLFLGLPARAEAQGLARPPTDNPAAQAGPAPAGCPQALEAAGFENVRVVATPSGLAIAYENRTYRYDARALRMVFQLCSTAVPPGGSLTVTPLRDGIPLLSVTAPAGPTGPSEGSLALTPSVTAPPTLWETTRRNASYGRLDLVLRPSIAFEFGNFTDPLEGQLYLMPEATVALGRGLRLRAGLRVRLRDELRPEQPVLEPGVLTLRQLVRLPRASFVAATAGRFTRDRYGLDFETRTFLFGGRAAAGGRAGYTGYADYTRRTWLYTPPNTLTYTLDLAAVVLPRYDVHVRVAAGRFFYGDDGVRLDVVRTFGEVDVAFFGLASEAGSNAGVALRLPLPASRHPHPRPIRFRLADDLTWEYRYRKLPSGGIRYGTGDGLDTVWQGLEPWLLGSRLRRLDASPPE